MNFQEKRKDKREITSLKDVEVLNLEAAFLLLKFDVTDRFKIVRQRAEILKKVKKNG